MRRLPRFLVLTLLGWMLAVPAATRCVRAETMSADHRDALERGCHQQAGADHVAYYNCIALTLGLLHTRTLVDLAPLPAAQRDRLRLACLGSKSLGLIAYDDCLRRQGQEGLAALPPARSADVPAAASRHAAEPALNPEQLFALA